ncbi:hypothetical protein IAI10_21130 [Clostridium sp. 19966]|uniref:hypothetical protein n=1 Tax=Clostridium sp. 19966 TaxID=2768166 RepID=UPI0028DE0912|nr:hypothetical protein [Clostridium sp. 19966]MDT8719158.1 hypothetical protein [Clostridium sp. 19966]
MNCHNDNKEIKSKHSHGSMRHMLHMIICCGLPIAIVFMLPVIGGISPGIAGILRKIVPFLCPIMMISMIPMMLGMNKDKKSQNPKKIIEDKKTMY